MKKFISLSLALFLALSLILTGCGNSSSASSGGTSGSSSGSSSALPSATPTDIVLGTAGSSGTYYVVGAAMANTINQHSNFLNVVAQTTNGSVENLNLCISGDIQMGMSNADGIYFASHGGNDYYKETQNIKGVMRLYESSGHMVTMADSGIKTYQDLVGKKVCLGPPSTTIVEMSKAILRAYGIDPEKDITPVYFSISEGLDKLTDGVIDATFFVGAQPVSGLSSAAATHKLSFVEADPEVLKQVCEQDTYYEPTTIPDGTYPGMSGCDTLKIYTEIFANGDVSDDAVYEFVKQALTNLSEYKDAHVSCQEIDPSTAWQTAAPLHPGAEKYYKEIGVLK